MVLLTLPIAALRWSIILRILGLRLPLMALVHMHAHRHRDGQFLFGTASADAVRGIYAWRALRGHTPRIAVSLLADRALSLAAMITLATLFMLLRLDRISRFRRLTALFVVGRARARRDRAIAGVALLLAPSGAGPPARARRRPPARRAAPVAGRHRHPGVPPSSRGRPRRRSRSR